MSDFPNIDHFHAFYTVSCTLLTYPVILPWRIVLNNIVLTFFLEYLFFCYIFVYREFLFDFSCSFTYIIYSFTYSKRTR